MSSSGIPGPVSACLSPFSRGSSHWALLVITESSDQWFIWTHRPPSLNESMMSRRFSKEGAKVSQYQSITNNQDGEGFAPDDASIASSEQMSLWLQAGVLDCPPVSHILDISLTPGSHYLESSYTFRHRPSSWSVCPPFTRHREVHSGRDASFIVLWGF